MEIYNTLTRKKEAFEPRKDKKVQMFVCGPTVYGHIHIGNARTFVFFDMVAKYLKYKGYDVDYVQNITDIDNKIIERAEKEGVDPLEYAKKYSDIFKQDMQSLGATSPEYKNATDHIPEVIKQVQTLLDKGNAYVIENDGIYFDLPTFPDYGKLSGRTASMADDAVSRIDDSDKKRNRGDFALWKFSQDNDPSWPAPFGDGRPGWHIEDTAITEKYFGPQYDIHGGGQDLIFPHHEAEIAQQESASGLKPFVKYWMHNGFLVNKEQKMSKSAGNFETVSELLKKHSRETLRQYLLTGSHYRSPLEFSQDVINDFKNRQHNLKETLGKIEYYKKLGKLSDSKESNLDSESYLKEIENILDDDFNILGAVGVLSGVISQANQLLESGKFTLATHEEFNKILGVFKKVLDIVPEVTLDMAKGEEIEALRKQGKTNESDAIRKEIILKGGIVQNTQSGTMVIAGIEITRADNKTK